MFKKQIQTLSLDIKEEEFFSSLEKDNLAIDNQVKKVWIKQKPDFLTNIDKQIRKKFNIEPNLQFVVSLYKPAPDEKTIVIKNTVKNSFINIIISSIDDKMIVKDKQESSEIDVKKWTAYYPFVFLTNSYDYEFVNTRQYNTTAKKGFRSIKKTKQFQDRYILKFDYILDSETFSNFTKNLFQDKKKETISILEDDYRQALTSLANSSNSS